MCVCIYTSIVVFRNEVNVYESSGPSIRQSIPHKVKVNRNRKYHTELYLFVIFHCIDTNKKGWYIGSVVDDQN